MAFDLDKVQFEEIQIDHSAFPHGTTFLILGEAKVGKTTFAKGFPNPLFLDMENGARFFPGIRRLNIVDINTPLRNKLDSLGNPMISDKNKFIMEKVPFLERGFFRNGQPAPGYSIAEAIKYIDSSFATERWGTVVLDTVDILNLLAEGEVMKAHDTNAMGNAKDFGKDWAESRQKVMRILKAIQGTCQKREIDFVILSHVKVASSPDLEDDEKTIQTIVPDLPSGLRKQVASIADVIGYAHKTRRGERLLSFKSTEQNIIGSRLTPLADKVIELSYEVMYNEYVNYNKPKEAPAAEVAAL